MRSCEDTFYGHSRLSCGGFFWQGRHSSIRQTKKPPPQYIENSNMLISHHFLCAAGKPAVATIPFLRQLLGPGPISLCAQFCQSNALQRGMASVFIFFSSFRTPPICIRTFVFSPRTPFFFLLCPQLLKSGHLFEAKLTHIIKDGWIVKLRHGPNSLERRYPRGLQGTNDRL